MLQMDWHGKGHVQESSPCQCNSGGSLSQLWLSLITSFLCKWSPTTTVSMLTELCTCRSGVPMVLMSTYFINIYWATKYQPAFQLATALEIFSQIIHGEMLHSTYVGTKWCAQHTSDCLSVNKDRYSVKYPLHLITTRSQLHLIIMLAGSSCRSMDASELPRHLSHQNVPLYSLPTTLINLTRPVWESASPDFLTTRARAQSHHRTLAVDQDTEYTEQIQIGQPDLVRCITHLYSARWSRRQVDLITMVASICVTCRNLISSKRATAPVIRKCWSSFEFGKTKLLCELKWTQLSILCIS